MASVSGLPSLALPLQLLSMRGRLGKCLIVTALVVATGGHWAILQSVAWLGMFVTYSQTSPVIVALEKTFDGQHPCKLCKVVKEGKESEKRHEMQKLETKLDFWLTRTSPAIFLPSLFCAFPPAVDFFRLRNESPPTPPPRLA